MESIYALPIFHLSALRNDDGAINLDSKTVIASVLLPLFIIWCVRWLLKPWHKLDFPIVGDPKASDFRSALEEGEKKVEYLHGDCL
jgi:hypothetical protein